MMELKNRKGFAVLTVIGVSAVLIMVVWLILLLPIPLFTYIRSQVKYFLILAVWILIQCAVIHGFWKIYKLVTQGVKEYKTKLLHWDSKIEQWLMLR